MKDFDESEHPRDNQGQFTFKDMADAAVLVGNTDFITKHIPISEHDHSASYGDVVSNNDLLKISKKAGKMLTQSEVLNLTGGLVEPGLRIDRLRFNHDVDPNGYRVELKTNKYEVIRTIDFKNKTIYNESMRVFPEYRAQGLGTWVFNNEVQQAKALGFKTISTYADRAESMTNGYYTWPRLGYKMVEDYQTEDRQDDPINAIDMVRNIADDNGIEANDITQLMSTQKGRDVWKREGFGHEAWFDLTPGSDSNIILNRVYHKKK